MFGIFRFFLVFSFFYFSPFSPAFFAYAEDSPPPKTEPSISQLPEFVVSDTRLRKENPSDPLQVPANITVIKDEDIKQVGARTAQETLQFQPSANLVDIVGNDFEQSIFLRGFVADVNPITVIVDGVRTNEPRSNTVKFDLVPIRDAARIEIRPGPSSIYGKNALGGVINVVTKRGKKEKEVNVDLELGSFQRHLLRGSASGTLEKFDYYLSGESEEEDGWREEAEADIKRFFANMGYRPNETTDLAFTFTSMNNNFQQPGPLTQAQIDADRNQATPGGPDSQKNRLLKGTMDLRHHFSKNFSMALNGFYFNQDSNSFLVFADGISFSDATTDTNSGGGTLQLTHNSRIGSAGNVLIGGGEFTRNDFEVFGSGFSTFTNSPNATDTESGENIFALFLQDDFAVLPQVTITAGVRSDWDRLSFNNLLLPQNSGTKSYNRVTPRAGITYRPSPEFSIFFSFSEGFRPPVQTELFATGPFSASPDLQPVTSQNYEVGGTIQKGPILAKFAFYRADVSNDIFFFCQAMCLSGANQNVEQTRRQGFEGSFKATLNTNLDGFVNYTYTNATFESRFLDFDATTFGFQVVEPGDSIPMVPQNQVAFGFNAYPLPGLTASMTGLAVGSRFLFGDKANTEDPLPGYVVFNARLVYEKIVGPDIFGFPGILTGFFQINNLFNHEYNLSGRYLSNTTPRFVPAPPISFYGGVSFTYNSGLNN